MTGLATEIIIIRAAIGWMVGLVGTGLIAGYLEAQPSGPRSGWIVIPILTARIPLLLGPYGVGLVVGRWANGLGEIAAYSAKHKNERVLARLEELLGRLSVETIVLEAFEKGSSTRRNRIEQLGRAIVAMAATHSVDVAVYTFADVRICFAAIGATTRHSIAEAMARQLPAISHLRPRPRRAWHAEHWRMSLFSAAALALTHYQLGAHDLLSELSESS